MHSHDPDLIASLAEGGLDPDALASAEADIAGCARCSADLAAHRVTLEAITAAPTVTLTADEAAMLRVSVADALGLSLEPAAPHTRKRRVPWGAVAVAGASLAAIVAVVPVLGLLSTGGGEDATGDLVAATFADQEVQSPQEPSGGDPARAPDDSEDAVLPPEPSPPSEGEGIVTTTTVAATTLAAEEALDVGRDLVALWNSPNELRAVLDDQPSLQRDAHACSEAALAILGPDLAVVAVPVALDGAPVAAYVATTDGVDRLVAFEPTDCALILTLPE